MGYVFTACRRLARGCCTRVRHAMDLRSGTRRYVAGLVSPYVCKSRPPRTGLCDGGIDGLFRSVCQSTECEYACFDSLSQVFRRSSHCDYLCSATAIRLQYGIRQLGPTATPVNSPFPITADCETALLSHSELAKTGFVASRTDG